MSFRNTRLSKTSHHIAALFATLLWLIVSTVSADLPTPAAALEAANLPEKALVVHYHNPAGGYENVGLWTWDLTEQRTPPESEQELYPVARSDYGALFVIDLDKYGAPGANNRIGMLPRFDKDWNKKDGGDKHWNESDGGASPWQVWLITGDPGVYSSRPSMETRPLRAFIDSPTDITVSFSYPMSGAQIQAANPELTWDGLADNIPASAKDSASAGSKIQYLELREPIIDVTRDYVLNFEGMDPVIALPRDILSDPEKYYDPNAKLGAFYSPEGTSFSVFAPTARRVSVVLYDKVEGHEGRREVVLSKGSKGVWSTTVSEDLKNKFYMYKVGGPGMAFSTETVDPYAFATPTGSIGTAERGMIVDWDSVTPKGYNDIPRPPLTNDNNTIIYEVHVRDFSIHPDSGITNKGKFLGFTEKDTHLAGDPSIKTGLAHILELGATHVQLLPIQNFDNDESKPNEYNWGYMPSHFNSPEGWFASDTNNTSRITEFMELVATLHEEGLRVIMDVVYNHTDNSAQFQNFVPFYYYRTNEEGYFTNGSGTGNEFKSENPMARKFIHDSCSFWVETYRVDGFRFDLMGLIDAETMVQLDAKLKEIDPTIQVWGEPWGAGALPDNPATFPGIAGTPMAAFNPVIRDLLKGDTFNAEDPGYIQGGEATVWELNGQMRGGWPKPGTQPTEVLQYCEAHDNYTLWDKLEKSTHGLSESVREEMQMLAGAILMTSQGKVFLHAGQEICRTKEGDHNSYNKPDNINWINYHWKKDRFRVFAYHRDLIALRKAHPVFHLTTKDEAMERMRFPTNLMTNQKMVVAWLDGRGIEGENWKEVLVVHYAGSEPVSFNLPERNHDNTFTGVTPWKTALHNWEFDSTGSVTPAQVQVDPRSSAIFYRE